MHAQTADAAHNSHQLSLFNMFLLTMLPILSTNAHTTSPGATVTINECKSHHRGFYRHTSLSCGAND